MDNKLGFLLKVLLLSTVVSVLIKYVGPSLAIPLSITNTLIAVFFPSIAIALIFTWRSFNSDTVNSTQ